jgi:anaerobic magnesium-protoporphyrin IX monomethyl ester cyclase
MARSDTLTVSQAKDPNAAERTAGNIVLFSPEHFYVFNTLAVPQLTGYLLERGYQVQQRVLDNELYTYLAEVATLEKALSELADRYRELGTDQIAYLGESIALARIPEELGFRSDDPAKMLYGLLRHRDAVVRLLHKSEALLRERFLGLSKNRFLLALARLQVAVDLCFAPYWPSKYGVLGGLEMECGTERSKAVFAATADVTRNPFLGYYRDRVVPSIRTDAVLAGISITHEAQIIPAFTLACVIREQRPDLHVTLGGATVSTLRETLGADNALVSLYDSAVVGAGEEAVASLHDELANGSGDLGRVPNLIWRRPDGSMQRNPERDFMPAQAATPVFTDSRPHPILTVASSTGCDWARCSFCHFPKILSDETRYCVRPADAFIRDIATLSERYRPSYFHICDTNVSVGQLDTLADALLDAGIDAKFYSFVRAEKAFTDIEFCRKIRRAGFFALHFGLESGSQHVLDRAHKGIDLQDVAQIIDNFYATDIVVNVFLMAGIPGETAEDVDKTVAFTRTHLAKIRGEIALCRFYLDLYSDIYYHPEAFGIEIQADPEEDLATNIRFHNPTGYNEGDMEALVDDVYARIGLPRSYGERFFLEMLDRFCPDGVGQRMTLYAPFVWGGVKRGLRSLVRSG